MKKVSRKWVFILCLIIVFSGILEANSLNYVIKSNTHLEENTNEQQQEFLNTEEEKPNDYQFKAENETHYQNLTEITTWQCPNYGSMNDLAIVDNITYITTNRGLVIYNTSNPTQPIFISQFLELGDTEELVVKNDLAYVVSYYENELSFVNCSDIYNPFIINEIWINNVLDFCIDDDIAYITSTGEFYGLQIYNISDLLNPQKISEYPAIVGEGLDDLQIQDDYLYCLTGIEKFVVFNISDLANPQIIIEQSTSSYYYKLFVENSYLYLFGSNSFQIWNHSNTLTLELCDTVSLDSGVGFFLYQDTVYVSNSNTQHPNLVIYDVSDPFNIVLLSTLDNILPDENFFNSEICVVGKTAIVTCDYKGFALVNVTDLFDVTNIAYEFTGYILGFQIMGDLALIQYEYYGIRIMNISDILNPIFITSWYIYGLWGQIFCENNLIYFYRIETRRFYIYNLINPNSPVELSHYDTSYTVYDIKKKNDIAILRCSDNYLLLDVSNPNNPTLLHDTITYDNTRDISIYNDFLFISGGYSPDYYLYIVNITNPLSPQYVSHFDLTVFPTIAETNGTYLYIYQYYPYRFDIYSIVDITNPVLVSQIQLPSSIAQLIFHENLLYIFRLYEPGLEIFELDSNYDFSLHSKLYDPNFSFSYLTSKSIIVGNYAFAVFEDRIIVIGLDSDGDLIADYLETAEYGTDPFDSDTDNDLMSDGYEINFQLDPLNETDALLDYDYDTLTNYDESLINTDPWLNDTDADFLTDNLEVFYGTNPLNPDTDNDMLTDFEEIFDYLTDPMNEDSDSDQLIDGEEILEHYTDPLDNDTDDDLMSDWFEVRYYLDPFSNDSYLDLDLDGLTNLEEFLLGTAPNNSDTDLDGYTDFEEVEEGTDPLDRDDYPDYTHNPLPTETASWLGGFLTTVFVLLVIVFYQSSHKNRYWRVKKK